MRLQNPAHDGQDMSPNTDEYWVGAFAMSTAIAHSYLSSNRPDMALVVLSDVLDRFAESPVLDAYLESELAPYWKPREEKSNDDQDVLRPLR